MFKSWLDYRNFATSVMRERRYIRTPPQMQYVSEVLHTCASRQETLAAKTRLWRAQLGTDLVAFNSADGRMRVFLPTALKPERMKPLIDQAREGRANPKGIPYLYLATHQETAVAEVRPWIGLDVTVAVFELSREIHIVDAIADDQRTMTYSGEPEPEERERAVWLDIDHAFSHPVTSAEDTAGYAPTQVIAEFFRENGFDGIAYGSSLGPGHNVVLFDVSAASLVDAEVVQIRGVKFEYLLVATVKHESV